jgi:hypothetical protein
MRFFTFLLLMFASLSARADAFYVLVGYICDIKNDQLQITYDGAYSEQGEAMVAHKRKTQWNPWTLVTAKDENHIGSLKTIRHDCHLSDGVYNISISPSPGNLNPNGRCGAWMTASAKVTKGRKTVRAISRFDNDCEDSDHPIITRVTIKPGHAIAEVLTVPWNEFYK